MRGGTGVSCAEGGLHLWAVHSVVVSRGWVCAYGVLEGTGLWRGNSETVATGAEFQGAEPLMGVVIPEASRPRPGQTFPEPWGRAGEVTWRAGRAGRTPPLRRSPAAALEQRVAARDSRV